MLLFKRSISLEALILLLVQQLCAQEEYGYDEEDHSAYHSEDGETHEHPDYSKYYSVDGPPADSSSPLLGFVGQSEFNGFFAPQAIEFAGSDKKHLTVPPIKFIPQGQQSQSLPIFSQNHQLNAPLRDYFEESQQKQQLKEDIIKPGPSYISHQLPLTGAETARADEVERIPPRSNRPKPKKANDDEIDETYKDEDEETAERDIEDKNDKYLELLKTKPFVDYNTGKSSSTVSQYPLAAGFPNVPSSKLTPYQKYSFQPQIQASRLVSDDYLIPKSSDTFNYQKKLDLGLPLEGQPTENVPSSLQNHDCRKIAGASSADMNCFVCVQADTKSKYTQCSYSSDKEPVAYNSGYSERFSAPAKEGHFRYRRFTDGRKDDPYYRIRNSAVKSFDEPSIPEDYSAGFIYEPESYDESKHEVSYSEQQSEELKKNPQNCKKVEKKGSTCTICRDPKTGANFEQCSYTSEPAEKKYAFVKERKYDSDDEPEETKIIAKADTAPEATVQTDGIGNVEKPNDSETVEKHDEQIEQLKSPKKRDNDENPFSYENYNKNRDISRAQYNKERYAIPEHFADAVVKESKNRNHNSEDDSASKDFDEYHLSLFPELSKEESRKEENKEDEDEDYHIPESSKQNVEAVLEEFTKKDRSNCKKSEKNGMTCFLCVDKNKMQHEECMFVQESRPQSTHVAYHQLKGIKKLDNDEQTEESKTKPILTEAEKSEFLKKETIPETLEAAASEGIERKISYDENKELYKKKRSPKKYKKKSIPEPTIKTPTEFEVTGEEGAFSAETRPVHSQLHGVQLPKYMVEKSEYEKEFDAFSGAH